ncbi:uncharacterized protein [Palaemon carinicauda]|uniref:uncharacterized protein n=1 Tax=Palaemon carinicauda TaxID=392227 RepID=UPI0035B5EF76
MKFAVVFIALVAAARAQQNEAWCRCAAFITGDDDETMVYEYPEIPIDSCEEHNKCKNKCITEFNEYTTYGDMWAMTPEGITVGQTICNTLTGLDKTYVHNHYVYCYYEVCGGPWEYTDQSSTGMLCCYEGEQVPCID